MLIDARANVNDEIDSGSTALLVASALDYQNYQKIVRKLLSPGNDVNVVNIFGNTALHEVLGDHHKKVLEVLLIHGAKYSSKPSEHARTRPW